jgi:hypothetical protein
MRALNAIVRGMNRVGMARIPLVQEDMLLEARRTTGLSDFGDERFLEPLGLLIRSAEQEADFNPVGRFMQSTNIQRLLRHRLYAQDLLIRYPEILEREIAAPVVIVGLPRSGTTRLHRLLAADERFLHLKAWESVNPVPLPESFTAREAGMVSWYRNDPAEKCWLLKSPQHLQDLDALMAVFPDARVICPHRDPIKVVGSSCSMAWNALVRDSDSLQADWVGTEWLGKIERMLQKTIRVREQMVPAARQYDVQYADITVDWQQSIQGIYDFLGIPLTDQATAGMRTWLDSNSQHKYGAHKYSLADFGLSADEVDQRLMFYRQRYGIPYEIRNPHLKPN